MVEAIFLYVLFFILALSTGVFKKVPNQTKTKGIICDLEQRNKVRRSIQSYTAIVSYTVRGKQYFINSRYQSSFFKKGKTITVLYDDENPEISYIRSSFLLYLIVIISFLFATFILIKNILSFFA